MPWPQSVNGNFSNRTAPRRKSPLRFFVLVFGLSTPFYLAGALTKLQLLPGLPASALAVVCPAMAASILSYREDKSAGVMELLKRSFDYRRIKAKVWYAPILLLMSGATVLTYGLMRVMGLPLPVLRFPVLAAPIMFVAFFMGALGEELGWSRYVIDLMQARWKALQAGILLGLVWAVWHWVPLLQAHRSLTWIAGGLSALSRRGFL